MLLSPSANHCPGAARIGLDQSGGLVGGDGEPPWLLLRKISLKQKLRLAAVLATFKPGRGWL